MRLAANQVLLISAAGILAVGAGLAANIAGTTPKYQGPDPGSLQALAARLEGQSALASAPELRGAGSANVGSRVYPAAGARASGSRTVTRTSATRPAPKIARAPAANTAQSAAAAKAEAVKNIALTGVTDGAGQALAWFVDISNNDRQTAEKGSAAFGFTVKEIHPDSVLLTSGSDEFVVRMGDKQVPSVVAASYESSEGAGPGGFGPGGFGPGGFGGGRGDRGDRGSDFMQRIADFRSRFGGGGFGGGGFGGGRSWGGGDSGGRSFGGGGDSGRSNSSASSSSGRSWGGGGFSGGGFNSFSGGFGGGFGGSSRGNSSRNTQTATSTSNPQTARRSGGRLLSGATALPTPDPISNPQTQRRTGTTSGQAFGDESANGSRNGFNNGSSRTSSFSNRGR